MKNIEIYKFNKNKHPDKIVILKSGNFYLTYDNDALILSYLSGYKILNNRVGFPLNTKDRIIDLLKGKSVSFIFVDDDVTFDGSDYYKYLKQSNYEILVDNMIETLNGLIKEKILSDFDNYEIIRKFVNEL